MIAFDPSQERVLELDPRRHARVLGAPGSGKTLLLVESFARIARAPGWSEADVLVLAPSRLVATRLRSHIELRWNGPLGGSVARTAASFAYGVLRAASASSGAVAPRLLTGTAEDETIASIVSEWIERGRARSLPFATEVLESAAFRAELREMASLLDSFSLDPDVLWEQLRSLAGERARSAYSRVPEAELLELWGAALPVLSEVRERLAADRPGEFSSSALLRNAADALASDEALPLPRVVLIDDAQELGEGELGLIAALARRGTRIWAFGDPDLATGAFYGERSRLLAGIETELRRKGAEDPSSAGEQVVRLATVHRHGSAIRSFVRGLSERVGSSGEHEHRAAEATSGADVGAIEFAIAPSPAVQIGMVGHRLRRRHLGLDGAPRVPWSEMAVICRSRDEAIRVARILAGHHVPTSVSAGGVVLREHQLVRELIRLTQHALGISPLRASEIAPLLGGFVGGLDPVALRRFRGALRLQDDREAHRQGRERVSTEALIWDGFTRPGDIPVIDSRGGRRLRTLGILARAGVTVHHRGGTPREVLWALWDGSGLAGSLQREALEGRGARAAEAHRALDAVMGLFFALQRHEEHASDRGIGDLLEELLSSAVPEDSLANRGARDVVTVTTPQGTIGREFSTVCVLGMQDGAWPNLRSRGLMLGVRPLERWLRGDAAEPPSRRDTLHDELRLLVQSVSRAREMLLTVAVSDEDHHPSSFFGLGREQLADAPPPSSRLTMRGAVASMRRRLTQDPADAEALTTLVELARIGAPGAHPDEWYGVLPPTTEEPVVDLTRPDASVRVSPSGIDSAERCPLDWVISSLGGGEGQLSANIGTLLHRALEHAVSTRDGAVPTADELMSVVEANWNALSFEAAWQADQQRAEVRAMTQSLSDYLHDFERSERRLLDSEAGFTARVGQAEISGVADRLEARLDGNGRKLISVVDLKTGRKFPSASEWEQHAQLQAYQLGVTEGVLGPEQSPGEGTSDGARLLYVHPKALNKTGPRYRLAEQPPLGPEAMTQFKERIARVAEIMAAGRFVANVEHHCSDDYAPGDACRLHIIPAVSQA